MGHTTKLISRRQLSSQVRQSPQNTRNERSHEVMATFRLDATGQPCRRTRQECCEGIVSITMKLIARQRLSLQRRHCRNSRAPKQTGGPFSTGSLKQIGQIHAHTTQASGSTKKAKTSSKNKRSHHDTWNARHAHNTRSKNSASVSTGSVRNTIPRQQDERERQQQQQHHIILAEFLK